MSFRLIVVICLLIALSLGGTLPAQQPKTRFFSDATGKFRVRALVMNINDTHVKLRKTDGDEITLPISKLSEVDQNYLKRAYQQYKAIAGDFPVGTKVEIFSSGGWHPGEVLQVKPGGYFITFDKYSDTWNKWVTAKELRLPAEPASQPKPNAASIPAASETATSSNGVPILTLEAVSDQAFEYDDGFNRSRFFPANQGSQSWPSAFSPEQGSPIPDVTLQLKKDSWAKFESFLPSPTGKTALLVRTYEVTALDLTTGKAMWVLPKPPETYAKVLAISDNGKRLAYAIQDRKGAPQGLRVYEIDGYTGRVLWQWRDGPESYPLHPIRAAYWLSNDRLGVLDEATFTVWNVDERAKHAVVKVNANSAAEISPDGSRMALVIDDRLNLFQTDGFQLDGVIHPIPGKVTAVSFRPDGQAMMLSGGEQAYFVSLPERQVKPIDIPYFKDKQERWIDNRLVLANDRYVMDWENNQILWEIVSSKQIGYPKLCAVKMVGTKFVMVDMENHRLLLRDYGDFIHPETFAKTPEPPLSLYAGVKVAISISGPDSGPYRGVIQEQLEGIIKRNGWIYDPGSRVKMEADVQRKSEELTFETMDQLGRRTGKETFAVPYARFGLTIMDGESYVWSTNFNSLVRASVKRTPGKSFRQDVIEQSRPDATRYGTLKVPTELRPQLKRRHFGITEASKLQ